MNKREITSAQELAQLVQSGVDCFLESKYPDQNVFSPKTIVTSMFDDRTAVVMPVWGGNKYLVRFDTCGLMFCYYFLSEVARVSK